MTGREGGGGGGVLEGMAGGGGGGRAREVRPRQAGGPLGPSPGGLWTRRHWTLPPFSHPTLSPQPTAPITVINQLWSRMLG